MADYIPPRRRYFQFNNKKHGINIELYGADTVAKRINTFCDGLVYTNEPLEKGKSFMVRVDAMKYNHHSGFAIGVMTSSSIRALQRKIPHTAFGIVKHCWILTSSLQNKNGRMNRTDLAAVLDQIRQFSYVTLHLKFNNELYLRVDGHPQVHIANIPPGVKKIYPVVDIYGAISQVTIVPELKHYSLSWKMQSIAECCEEEEEEQSE